MRLLCLFSAALFLRLASLCAAAFTVSWDTTPSWVGYGGIEIFGDVAYAYPACGQSFTAPAGINAMQSFTFFLNDRLNPDPVRFTANLVGWDGVKPVGPILFTSAPVTTSNNHGLGGMEPFQFSMPDIAVNPGQQYLAFLTSVGVSGSLVGSAFVGVVSGANGDVLPGGQTYVNFLAFAFQGLYDQPWSFVQPSTDLAFRAQFTAIPEPTIAAQGLFCLALLAASRSKAGMESKHCSGTGTRLTQVAMTGKAGGLNWQMARRHQALRRRLSVELHAWHQAPQPSPAGRGRSVLRLASRPNVSNSAPAWMTGHPLLGACHCPHLKWAT